VASASRTRTEHLAVDDHGDHGTIRHVQDLTMTETAFRAAYGVSGGFGLEALVFLRHVTTGIRFEDLDRRPIELPGGDIHHRDETLLGPGDPWLLAVHGRSVGPWSAALRAGVAIPLGRTEENPFALGRQGLPHQHIQFGTGTWDPLAGAAVGRKLGEVALSASVLARLPVATNAHGYRAGRRVFASLAGDRAIGGQWRLQAGLDYGHETAETWAGIVEEEGNLGRSDLLGAIGLARAIGGRALVLTVRIPLRTRSSGVQVDYPAIVSLGWHQ
jgi:hypothetical protein